MPQSVITEEKLNEIFSVKTPMEVKSLLIGVTENIKSSEQRFKIRRTVDEIFERYESAGYEDKLTLELQKYASDLRFARKGMRVI